MRGRFEKGSVYSETCSLLILLVFNAFQIQHFGLQFMDVFGFERSLLDVIFFVRR